MRGRKPKPASLQQAAGDPRKRGKNKLQERVNSEASATRGLPQCPRHLRGRARAAWGFWAEELFAMELDRRPDAMMLEGACVGYARAVEADKILAAEGLIVEESIIDDESGEKIILKRKTHPAVGISRAAWTQLRAFCSEFGLSPVSRTRLSIEKKRDTEGDLMAMLSAPREPRAPAVN